MIRVVGHKIVMQQGESGGIKFMMLDPKGNELPLSDTDTITLRMKYAMESTIPCFKKKTTHVTVDDKLYHIFQFNSTDTKNLPAGDYNYEVILESDNKRFTIISKSVLTLQEAVALDDSEDDRTDGIIIYDADTEIDYYSIVTSTPLVGSFNVTSYTKVGEVDGNVIMF